MSTYPQQTQPYPQQPQPGFQQPQPYVQQPQPYAQPSPPVIQQQPVATAAMTAGPGGNRNVKNLPFDADGRAWSNGLCDCCNEPGTCFMSCCCHCIVYGQNKHRLDHLERNGTPDPEHGGCCNSDCMIQACLTYFGFGWVLLMGNRSHTRSRYKIKGGSCNDCCASCYCIPCVLTQESQELELEEKSFPGFKNT